jgi:hypothetical protein
LSLKVLSGIDTVGLIRQVYPDSGADIDGDHKIGLAEVIYIMQAVAEAR